MSYRGTWLSITVLLVVIPIPLAMSQLRPKDIIPEELETAEQIFTSEQIYELDLFASNGTSFDSYIKQYSGFSDFDQNEIINDLITMGEYLSPMVGLCSTPQAQTVYSTLCDAVVATVYEMCQGIQYEVFICTSQDVPNYIKSRNLSEEQTSNLAYSLILDLVQ